MGWKYAGDFFGSVGGFVPHLLVRPARPTRGPNSKQTGTRTLTAKSNTTASIAVINQAKRLSDYLEKFKQTSPSQQQNIHTH